MEPDQIMNGISKEIDQILKLMSKAKTLEEKLTYSEAVKNLCESLGVFLSLMADMMPYDDDSDEQLPF